MTVETTPWWGFLTIGFLVGFQWGFSGLSLLFQRRDWNTFKAEHRRREQLEAEHDAERVMLNEVFRAKRNQEFRTARRITLADLAELRPGATDTMIGMEKRGKN